MNLKESIFLLLSFHCFEVKAFGAPNNFRLNTVTRVNVVRQDSMQLNAIDKTGERRNFLEGLVIGLSLPFVTMAPPANALVKGKCIS